MDNLIGAKSAFARQYLLQAFFQRFDNSVSLITD